MRATRLITASIVVFGLFLSEIPAHAQTCYPNCPPTSQPPTLTLSGPSTVVNGGTINIVASGNNVGPAATIVGTASISDTGGTTSATAAEKTKKVKAAGVKATRTKATSVKAADLDIPSFTSGGSIFAFIRSFFRSIFGDVNFGGGKKKKKKRRGDKGPVASVSPASQSANVPSGGAFSFVFNVTGLRRGTASLTVCSTVQGTSTARTCRSTSISVTR